MGGKLQILTNSKSCQYTYLNINPPAAPTPSGLPTVGSGSIDGNRMYRIRTLYVNNLLTGKNQKLEITKCTNVLIVK